MFPKILRQLGCETVAINSSIDELRMFRTAEQFDQEMQQLGAITKTLNFDFGVRIDLGGEKIFLVDNTGRLLDRMTAFAAAGLVVLLPPARWLHRGPGWRADAVRAPG